TAQRSLVAVPLYHKNALAGAVKPRLHSGGSLVLLPNFQARDFLFALANYRCTNISGVPAVFSLALEQHDLIDSLDFSSLEGITIGAAPLHETLIADVEAAFGAPGFQSSALTEGGPVMFGPPLDNTPVPIGSVGRPWVDGEVKLVGSDGS